MLSSPPRRFLFKGKRISRIKRTSRPRAVSSAHAAGQPEMVKGSILGSGPQVFPHRGNLSVALKRISRIKKTSRPWAVSSAHAAGQMVTDNGSILGSGPKAFPCDTGPDQPDSCDTGTDQPAEGA